MSQRLEIYIRLGIVALVPAVVTLVLLVIDNKTKFSKVPGWLKQIIYGLIFGGLAIFGTEKGVLMNENAIINARDSAVVIAGLFFGAPAGIIAGVIGAVERWIAVAWGAGEFTRVACCVSTLLAGIYTAALRHYLFENKAPNFGISFATGVVIEDFHMIMVFLTNIKEPIRAAKVVFACWMPMIIVNAFAIMIAGILVTLFEKRTLVNKKEKKTMLQLLQRKLFLLVVIMYAISSFFLFSLQKGLADKQIDNQLESGIYDVRVALENGKGAMEVAKYRTIGKMGGVVVTNSVGDICSSPIGFSIKNISDPTKYLDKGSYVDNGETYIVLSEKYSEFYIVAFMPETEANEQLKIALVVYTLIEVIIFALIFVLFAFVIRSTVAKPLHKVNKSLDIITSGKLNEKVNVRNSMEFDELTDSINSTVNALNERIDAELRVAKQIQFSSLPDVTPAILAHKEFEIGAFMSTAKDVGGDFYDFYLTDNNMLNFLIADVSGKGIPAAMFMMRAKTELKTLTESRKSLDEVFSEGNDALFNDNDANMFVTAWQGAINLNTGTVTYVNAGHNPPAIKRANGKFEYLKAPAAFVLAGIGGMSYSLQKLQLEAGDTIFLYTDGVTEATAVDNELYGEERLLNVLNTCVDDNMDDLCALVRNDVDKFVGTAPQFDDMTMLAIRFNGCDTAQSITFNRADINDMPAVLNLCETELTKYNCDEKAKQSICIAIDEIYSNIAKFAYNDGTMGPVTVKIAVEDNTAVITFIDKGTPYDPLAAESPDLEANIENCKIGGLGIFMVKQMMDDLQYKYTGGSNVLKMTKVIK